MWALYGWWLPNDPRGSTSRTIQKDVLHSLGELHHGRNPIQPASREIRSFYRQASGNLDHSLLRLSPGEFDLVAHAISDSIERNCYTCYACAIMPDHIHILIRKHRDSAEQMIANIQFDSLRMIRTSGLRPMSHPVWTRGGWKVFLDHPDDIWRTIRYVEANARRHKLPEQKWSFVKRYDNWPLHHGHSQNSPYVKALKRVGRHPR